MNPSCPICPECGGIAYYDNYYGRYRCTRCSWEGDYQSAHQDPDTEPEKETLHFGIDPTFITSTVRSWFWDEGKSWATLEELLLECMKGTDLSREELVAIAKKIVFGEKKLVACEDGSADAVLADDDKDLVIQNVAAMHARISKLEKELKESQTVLQDLLDRIEDSGVRIPDSHLILKEDEDRDNYDEEKGPISYLPDDYGWLSPAGEFTEVEYGGHDAWAMKKVNDDPELLRFAKELPEWPRCNWGDILCKRGWVLLDNPSMDMAIVTRDESRNLTKAQSEFLYGYYKDRGYDREAEKYLK